MRRLITLISAGRNRTIVIRRELPRTKDAGWAMEPYRIKGRRILLSVSPRPVTSTVALPYAEASMRRSARNKACHSLFSANGFFAPASGPVEPKGGLDGWRGCKTIEVEGMAGMELAKRPSVVFGIWPPCGRQWPR